MLIEWMNLKPGHVNSLFWRIEGIRLLFSWSLWFRHYHNKSHLKAMLEKAPENVNLKLAIWYHDAVYWAWSSKNEENSAKWAVKSLKRFSIPYETVERLILITKTHQAGNDPLDALMLDIDLAILGENTEVYDIYEKNIRKEYFFVSAKAYREGRRKILQGFLNRPHIYLTPDYREEYEAKARENLARAIEALGL